jgi:hypothetical protein
MTEPSQQIECAQRAAHMPHHWKPGRCGAGNQSKTTPGAAAMPSFGPRDDTGMMHTPTTWSTYLHPQQQPRFGLSRMNNGLEYEGPDFYSVEMETNGEGYRNSFSFHDVNGGSREGGTYRCNHYTSCGETFSYAPLTPTRPLSEAPQPKRNHRSKQQHRAMMEQRRLHLTTLQHQNQKRHSQWNTASLEQQEDGQRGDPRRLCPFERHPHPSSRTSGHNSNSGINLVPLPAMSRIWKQRRAEMYFGVRRRGCHG